MYSLGNKEDATLLAISSLLRVSFPSELPVSCFWDIFAAKIGWSGPKGTAFAPVLDLELILELRRYEELSRPV